MHSFSYNIKEEILLGINTKDKADAAMLGLLSFANSLDDKRIMLLTENERVKDFFKLNAERICGEGSVLVDESLKRGEQTLYTIDIQGEAERIELLSYLQIDSSRRLTDDDLPKEKLCPYVIAGAFLACGSVNDPLKKYHLEFVVPTLELCNDLGLLLVERYGILCKHTERGQTNIVYLKESESIIDMLTLMGASNGSIELMNVKIEKDMRNKINRAVNCDNANIEKALRASERQIKDIELIDSTVGLSSLSDALREIAVLRYENPDLNLSQLGELVEPKISRSGVNHRFQKISALAERIRKDKGITE